ncbi:hypothetical protein G7Z17_g8424 [Cylindrodendrum hubeiense]|uniref:Uncharacterized protein n=1 Tax=Cylindrodendrum hubeiense TaxID=595255 RepID=A0A9P5H185_9HYPO|nr:hypothetical protein G7Z17_g8424 [Cylindrodendrum hubeiense]
MFSIQRLGQLHFLRAGSMDVACMPAEDSVWLVRYGYSALLSVFWPRPQPGDLRTSLAADGEYREVETSAFICLKREAVAQQMPQRKLISQTYAPTQDFPACTFNPKLPVSGKARRSPSRTLSAPKWLLESEAPGRR